MSDSKTYWVTVTRTIVAVDHRVITAASEAEARRIAAERFLVVPESCVVQEERIDCQPQPTDRELWEDMQASEGCGYADEVNEAEFSEERA
jgi:hypothetical protein